MSTAHLQINHTADGYELWQKGKILAPAFQNLRDLYDAFPRAAFASVWCEGKVEIL